MSAAKDSRAEKVAITNKLNDFVQRNRGKLLIGLIIILVILAGIVIFTMVKGRIQESALIKADAFNRRYEALKPYISGEGPDAASKQADINTLLGELNAFAARNSGFAAARVYTLSAEIYWGQKKWAEAGKAWIASADSAAKTYLAPISIYNAAVAEEAQGNIQPAIDLYTRAINYGDDFPAAARAQFAVGRLEESRSNREAALEAYKTVVNKWPNDPIYANLAQSRMIVLSD